MLLGSTRHAALPPRRLKLQAKLDVLTNRCFGLADGNPLVSVPSLAEFAQRLTDGGKRKEDWRSVTILAFEGATRKG